MKKENLIAAQARSYFVPVPNGVVERDYRMIDRMIPTLGGKPHPNPQHWYELLWQAKERDLFACVGCGRHERFCTLDVHHRTYLRWGHELLSDVYTYCRPCHKQLHRREQREPAASLVSVAESGCAAKLKLAARRIADLIKRSRQFGQVDNQLVGALAAAEEARDDLNRLASYLFAGKDDNTEVFRFSKPFLRECVSRVLYTSNLACSAPYLLPGSVPWREVGKWWHEQTKRAVAHEAAHAIVAYKQWGIKSIVRLQFFGPIGVTTVKIPPTATAFEILKFCAAGAASERLYDELAA